MGFTYSHLFRMISHKMKQKASQKLEQFDIINEQGYTLGYLHAHQQDGLIQNNITKALQRTGPTVSNLLRNLERKKLIYCYVDAQDTGRKNVGLTTSRIKFVKAFASIFDEMEQILISRLSEEENKQVKTNLTKMSSSLQ